MQIGGGGVLIEADSNVFAKLLSNRPNPNVAKYNVAICEYDGEVEFLQVSGYAQMLSGIVSAYDKRHLERIEREVRRFGGSINKIKMQGARFDSIMKNHQRHIDYLSIDVEGGEMGILKSIDFSAYDITLIGIENNYYTNEIPNFLHDKGYVKFIRLGCDEFYTKPHKGQGIG
ncbi:FkbM family methyltransferase [uncultured Helicobacter sp.]|uniref:FkbM family methyltransferase n=1 Tax=uncultured Helicobacter sp. TaxID=175537 RepID=UPI003753E312